MEIQKSGTDEPICREGMEMQMQIMIYVSVDTVGEGEGETNGDSNIDIDTLSCVKQLVGGCYITQGAQPGAL